MMSRRPDQQGLFSADTQYLDFLGPESFYGFLAQHGRELFADEDFAELYCPDNGRPSVAPSPLAIALLLQARALEKTDHFREQYRQRIVVEHRIARLVQFGGAQKQVLRTGEDEVPALDGGDGGEPDAGGEGDRFSRLFALGFGAFGGAARLLGRTGASKANLAWRSASGGRMRSHYRTGRPTRTPS